ncbi:MAG: GNAT family N-acetyltransferase [Clostridia bacterium]|nr:GNAT family N-acetyltransferase [Clostridia bacterium]
MKNNWKQTTLTTPRLILRPWVEDDAEKLYRFAKDPLVGPPAGWPPHTSVENSREIIRRILSARETYAMVLRYDTRDTVSGEVIAAGTPVGSVGIMFKGCGSYPHIVSTEAEIGYWVALPLWGRGLVPEAVRAVQKRCFTALGLDGLWCGYYEGNEKSRRVQEKCGFSPRCSMEIAPHPLNGATKENFTYLSREDWEVFHAPMTHEMSLRERPFRAVASGEKVVEMRLYDPKRQLIQARDCIRFTLVGGNGSVTARVVGLHYFPSFKELYAALLPVVGAVGLGYARGDTPIPDDMLDYYSEDAINRFGVVGIEIKLKEI